MLSQMVCILNNSASGGCFNKLYDYRVVYVITHFGETFTRLPKFMFKFSVHSMPFQ